VNNTKTAKAPRPIEREARHLDPPIIGGRSRSCSVSHPDAGASEYRYCTGRGRKGQGAQPAIVGQQKDGANAKNTSLILSVRPEHDECTQRESSE